MLDSCNYFVGFVHLNVNLTNSDDFLAILSRFLIYILILLLQIVNENMTPLYSKILYPEDNRKKIRCRVTNPRFDDIIDSSEKEIAGYSSYNFFNVSCKKFFPFYDCQKT